MEVKWTGHVARTGVMRSADRFLSEKLEGKRSFGRLRNRWEGNIRMNFRGIGWEVVEWINLAQDRTSDGWALMIMVMDVLLNLLIGLLEACGRTCYELSARNV
jgi:hypothetical protein